MPATIAAHIESVVVPADAPLLGDLAVPSDARGLIIFAHGSGSSRLSPRNQWVASQLQSDGFATLLVDLLAQREENIDEVTLRYRFDIALLARRLIDATEWVRQQERVTRLPIGYFGASTGAAAALVAAASRSDLVRAVVSRGGRPDLAGPYLNRVYCPTLFIVGGNDRPTLAANRGALARLATTERQLAVVPGATHLFEEPGTLDRVAMLAAGWFERHVAAGPEPADELC